ncbi:dipeptidyl aminopeptidase 4 [Tanacetum coccineum]
MHQGKSTVGSEAQEEHAYSLAGASNVKVHLGVVPVIGGSMTWMDLFCGGNPDDEYQARKFVDVHDSLDSPPTVSLFAP